MPSSHQVALTDQAINVSTLAPAAPLQEQPTLQHFRNSSPESVRERFSWTGKSKRKKAKPDIGPVVQVDATTSTGERLDSESSEEAEVASILSLGDQEDLQDREQGEDQELAQNEQVHQGPEHGSPQGPGLITHCGCKEHTGHLIADEIFDVNVDRLFRVIFDDPEFMCLCMERRGMVGGVVSKWSRESNSKSMGQNGIHSRLDNNHHDDESDNIFKAGRLEGSMSQDDAYKGAGSVVDGCSEGDQEDQEEEEEEIQKTWSSRDHDDEQPDQQKEHDETKHCAEETHNQDIKIKHVRHLSYSMSINHLWAKEVKIEERQNIRRIKPDVYVLESHSQNSGVPYGDTFTVDISYCLTRHGDPNKSRMLIHCMINFKKDKNNWGLAMVKPVIEHKSLQGVKDFVTDLTKCVRSYLNGERSAKKAHGIELDDVTRPSAKRVKQSSRSPRANDSWASRLAEGLGFQKAAPTPLAGETSFVVIPRSSGSIPNLGSKRLMKNQRRKSSLIRAKSKLKEKKLRSIYRYYIRAAEGSTLDLHRDSASTDGRLESHSEQGSSLNSLSDLGDNESMLMLARASEDQSSDHSSSTCKTSPALNRSFSDVELRARHRRRRQRAAGSSTPVSVARRVRARARFRDQAKGAGPQVETRNGLTGYLAYLSGRVGSLLLLALLLVVLIGCNVEILRRIERLEQSLEMKCFGSVEQSGPNLSSHGCRAC